MARHTTNGQVAGHAELRLRPGAITWREIDGELVLLDLETSSYLNVNAAGTLLWPALERGTSRADLVRLLSDRFGIDAPAATADIDAFVSDVRRLGYLVD